MFESDKSISQISNELGFKYPHHFTRFFKQNEGLTPKEYILSKIKSTNHK